MRCPLLCCTLFLTSIHRYIDAAWANITAKCYKTSPARALVVFTPAGLDEAFKQLGKPTQSAILLPPPKVPSDMQKIVAVFDAYGIEFATSPMQ